MNNTNKAALEQRKRLSAAAKSWYGDNYSPTLLNPETDTKFYLGEDYIPYDATAIESDNKILQSYNQIMTDANPDPVKGCTDEATAEGLNHMNSFNLGLGHRQSESTPNFVVRAKINDFFPDSSNPRHPINFFTKNRATLPHTKNNEQSPALEEGLDKNFMAYRAKRAPQESNLTYWNYADETHAMETSDDRQLRGRERRHKFNQNENFRIRLLPDNRLAKTEDNDNDPIGTVWPFYTIAFYGKDYVDKYHDEIEDAARKYQIDPDLIRATMFTEMATGHWMGLNAYRDKKGKSKTQMPMNINGSLWSDLGGNKFDTNNTTENIENAALLLKKISETQDQQNNILAIGSLWNGLGTNHLNKIGVRIDDAYRRRLWENKIPYGIINNPYDRLVNEVYLWYIAD